MDNLTDHSYLLEYKKRSYLIGKDLFVLKGNETKPAQAIDIDDSARLIVEYLDGTREALSSGEVSVRTKL
jgi:BirA family biotin operon repressor/biotin-[acetyl-CoA-carboxylase] ligase